MIHQIDGPEMISRVNSNQSHQCKSVTGIIEPSVAQNEACKKANNRCKSRQRRSAVCPTEQTPWICLRSPNEPFYLKKQSFFSKLANPIVEKAIYCIFPRFRPWRTISKILKKYVLQISLRYRISGPSTPAWSAVVLPKMYIEKIFEEITRHGHY